MFMRFKLAPLFCCAFFVCSLTALSAPSFASFEQDAKDGFSARKIGASLPSDLWQGLSLEETTSLIEQIPTEFASPIYRSMLRDLMLAENEGFSVRKPDQTVTRFADLKYDKQALSEEQYLGFLKLRFDTLYNIGAFEDATALYEDIYSKYPQDTDLILYGLYPLLLKGNVSGFCLDVETLKIDIEAAPRIADLKLFCRSYFEKQEQEQEQASTPTSEANENSEMDTKDNFEGALPPPNPAAKAEAHELEEISSFKVLKGLNLLLNTQASITRDTFSRLSMSEKLLAHALGRIDISSFTSSFAQNQDVASTLPLSTLKILSLQNGANIPQHSCIMNEAYKKGLISADGLLLYYQSIPFTPEQLDSSSYTRQTLHPCQKPAWYINHINQANNDEQRSEYLYESLAALVDSHPASVQVYHSVFKDLEPSNMNNIQKWFVAEAKIKEGSAFSKSWLKDSITINDSVNSAPNRYISPDWYILVLDSPDIFTIEDYMTWLETGFTELPFSSSFAPARPLTLLKNTLKLKIYEPALYMHYEKFFHLTFSRNYVIYNDSLISRVNAAIENEHTGKSMLLLLHMLNNQNPADIYPQYGNYLLDLFLRIGYKQYARHFIVDTLSVGKN